MRNMALNHFLSHTYSLQTHKHSQTHTTQATLMLMNQYVKLNQWMNYSTARQSNPDC